MGEISFPSAAGNLFSRTAWTLWRTPDTQVRTDPAGAGEAEMTRREDFVEAAAVDVQALKIALVGEGPEIAERAGRAQPDRGPDAVPDEAVEAATRLPGERHAQPEAARDPPVLASRRDGPDVDEEDIPVGFAPRRAIEPAGDIDISVRSIRTERIALIPAIMDRQAARAQGGDGGDDEERRRAVAARREARPSRADAGGG